MSKHRHLCGLRSWADNIPENVVGCGFLWEHERTVGDASRIYSAKHICPNCGLGPWFGIVTEIADLLRPLTPMPPVIAFGRVLRPAPDNRAHMPRHELAEFYEYARSGDTPLERELNHFINQLIGEMPEAARGMEVIIFDEDNHSITGVNLRR